MILHHREESQCDMYHREMQIMDMSNGEMAKRSFSAIWPNREAFQSLAS
jgi:hypothetical protein